MRRAVAGRMMAIGGVALLWAGSAQAQFQLPDKFTNLKVLPKDISKEDLIRTMRGWSGALGVRCDQCHEEAPPGTRPDFASDTRWEKRAARDMVRMVAALNGDYLAHLEARPASATTPTSAALHVECVTCHRGLPRPETIDSVVAGVLAKDGVDAAIGKYKELRERYLTSGSYDFSDRPLNALGERLLGEGKGGEALAFLKVDTELNPSSGSAAYLLGDAKLATGDRDGAKDAFEKSLALDPRNPRARRKLEELKAAPSPKP